MPSAGSHPTPTDRGDKGFRIDRLHVFPSPQESELTAKLDHPSVVNPEDSYAESRLR
jgi:hypothetical protein